jgi:hypothetical protein
MKPQIDYADWIKEGQRAATMSPAVKGVARNRVKIVALRVVGRVKIQMPVDTGAARARWGIPGAPGGIWQEEDDGLTITQGAGVEPYEYIERLNEGSSMQAPAGFLDAIAFKAEEELLNELGDDLVKEWGKR